jgi:hypothetical protein
MAIYKKGYYDLYMFQGDTGNIKVQGIPETINYMVYFEVRSMDGSQVIFEKQVECNHKREVVIPISASDTDNIQPGTYCYAVKLCSPTCAGDFSEETVIPPLKNTSSSPSTYKNKALFLIYPKQIEGTEQW